MLPDVVMDAAAQPFGNAILYLTHHSKLAYHYV